MQKAKEPRPYFNKEKILERDLYLCVYCGDIATVIDHVIPYSWSRCNDENNLVAACSLCNHLATNMVFRNFSEKKDYITRTLAKRRKQNKTQTWVCNECQAVFVPLKNGATNFVCSECAKRQHSRRKTKWETRVSK